MIGLSLLLTTVLASPPDAGFAYLLPDGQMNMSQPLNAQNLIRVSEHVWALAGFPNIGIVVGSQATLLVDTGLGATNGATAAAVAQSLAPHNSKLFLTTTHFHPEHATGEVGFPRNTVLIRDRVQQQEMQAHGQEIIDVFKTLSAENLRLLTGITLRPPDITFDEQVALDLGGVTVRLLWLGEAHTKGDELTFVEPDRTLISGDVVQNKTVPHIYGVGGTPSTWLAVLAKVSALNPAHILPDHSPPGDGSLIAEERALLTEIRSKARAFKSGGMSVEDAGQRVSASLKVEHPNWLDTNVDGFVKSVYADVP